VLWQLLAGVTVGWKELQAGDHTDTQPART